MGNSADNDPQALSDQALEDASAGVIPYVTRRPAEQPDPSTKVTTGDAASFPGQEATSFDPAGPNDPASLKIVDPNVKG